MSGFVVVGLVIVVAFVAGHLYFVAERKNVDAADRFYSAGVDAFVDERRRTDYPEDCKKGWQRVAFEDGWDNSLMTLEWLRRRDQDIEKLREAIGLVLKNIREDLGPNGMCSYCGFEYHSSDCPWEMTMDACRYALGVEG